MMDDQCFGDGYFLVMGGRKHGMVIFCKALEIRKSSMGIIPYRAVMFGSEVFLMSGL